MSGRGARRPDAGRQVAAIQALHEDGTLVVVFNALRLLAYKDRTATETPTAQ